MEILYEDKCPHVPDQDLIDDLNRTIQMLQTNTLTIAEYDEHGTFNSSTIIRRFGTWNNGLQLAGITISNKFYTDQELFNNLATVWLKLGKQPSRRDLTRTNSPISYKAYERRFGKWSDAVKTFVDYYNSSKDEYDITNDSPAKGNNLRTKTRDVSLRLRFQVMRRDNFKCCICGASPAKDPSTELHIDHVIPWSKGGETSLENLQTLCSICNLGKSNLI
ncbi:MAG: HNH endonuclease [Oscillospiraceae bacterium]|nr:HNH endonuclease [Oscillospiraceae bacterium]